MNNYKKILGYFLFVVLVTLFFLYYHFPSDMVGEYINKKLKQAAPDLTILIENFEPALFPPGIVLNNVKVDNDSGRVFESNRVKIRPKLTSLFHAKTILYFNSQNYSGILDGDLGFMQNNPDFPINLNANWKDINISEINMVRNLNYKINGTTNGILTYNGPKNQIINGNSEANFIILKSTIELSEPFLNMIEKIQLESIKAKFALKDKILNLKQCIIKGDLEGSISGTISMNIPFNTSRLKIKGKLKPSDSFLKEKNLPLGAFLKPDMLKKGIPISISGTIDQPGLNVQ
ncbi:putative Type II secretion system protein GspN [Candidatus Magnetomoraceae bacterium gMMP-15]